MVIVNPFRLLAGGRGVLIALVAAAALSCTSVAWARIKLTISGTPATSDQAGTKYSFQPVVTVSGARYAPRFAIAQKPTWASFNTTTGLLSGTPTASQVGTYGGIVISVSDGTAYAALAPFSITVTSQPPPTISGTPPTTVVAGSAYSFQPQATGPSGSTISFSVQNKPVWASFSIATGLLSGTPTSSQVGTYGGIVISASDGIASAALPTFSIGVTAPPTPTNTPPVISGTPATSVQADQAYSFTPSASDPDGDALTFSIQNKPSWASFSTSSGQLSGTPTSSNVGTSSNVVISVSDGTQSASLAAFSIQVTAASSSGSGSTYALPANRTTAWNPGMMSKGGIASASWPVCNATPLTPSGSSDDSVQINNAISNCAAGTVVQLGAGTFLMGRGSYVALNKGVVLRGAGAGKTILKNPLNVFATSSNQAPVDATPIVIIGPGRWVNADGDARCAGPTAYQTAYMQLLSADGAQGSYSITVANGSIFSAGQMVLLDETSGASWQPDVAQISTSIWASPDYAVAWQLHNPASGVDDPLQPGVTPSAANNYSGTGSGSDAACWFSRQDRPQNEIKEIASVSGNTITFTSPLTKAYRASHHAELTTYTGSNAPVQNAGLEKLTAVGGGDGAVRFEDTRYSWAKNIEVTEWYGEGVAMENSFRDELRDSYIHDASWPEPGGAGYAISFAFASSEALIENNIVLKANKMMVARSSGAGSVVGYNYMDDGYIATTEGWIEIGLNASHMVGSHMVLFEGNQSFNIDSDDTHGNSTYMVYFRNMTSSVRSKFQSDYTGNTIDDLTSSGNGPKRAAGAMRYGYWMSYVGNVLGQQGVTTAANGYVDDETSTTWNPAIWLLGWNDIAPYTVDTKVAATALRDGNWDGYLGQQTWLTGTQGTLPSSLYLASKPAFFGSNTWPWVDPTTGTTYVLPAKARYDAGTPNTVP